MPSDAFRRQRPIPAPEGFDPRKGFRFCTYATRSIRQAIGRMLDKTTSDVHLPIATCCSLRAALRSSGRHAATLPPEWQEVALLHDGRSVDDPVGSAGTPLGSLLAANNPSVESVVLRRAQSEVLVRSLDALPPLQQRALTMRFGLDGGPERSYGEIAEALSVSIRDVSSAISCGKYRLRRSRELAMFALPADNNGAPAPAMSSAATGVRRHDSTTRSLR